MANTPISTSLSTLTLTSDGALYADGTTSVAVVATIKDTGGNLVGVGSSGQDAAAEVTFLADGTRFTMTQASKLTGTDGTNTAAMTSFRSGTKTVRAKVRHDDDQISAANRPTTSNTGLSNEAGLSPTSGSTIVASISDEEITGTLTIGANDLLIENCRVTASQADLYAVVSDGYSGVTFRDCEFVGGLMACVYGRRFRLEKCYVHGSQQHGVYVTSSPNFNLTMVESCLITDVPGVGVRAHDCKVVTVRASYIDLAATATACVEAIGTTAVVSTITVESNWLNGGITTVKITDGGAGVPLNSPVQNIRWGADYGAGGLLEHDATDSSPGTDPQTGSLLKWGIWDSNIQHIATGDVAGTWVNRDLDLAAEGSFKYSFPMYTLDATLSVAFQLAPITSRGQVSAGETEAGGVSA